MSENSAGKRPHLDYEKYKDWPGDTVKFSVYIPTSVRKKYKAVLACEDSTIQSDLEDFVLWRCGHRDDKMANAIAASIERNKPVLDILAKK